MDNRQAFRCRPGQVIPCDQPKDVRIEYREPTTLEVLEAAKSKGWRTSNAVSVRYAERNADW